MPQRQPIQIACQQVLVDDNSVFSIQWTDLAPELAAGLTVERLLEHYLAAIRQLTIGLIQPTRTADGISFNLFGRLPLLCFLPPEPEQDWLAMRICGGFLVQRDQCDRGELAFNCSVINTGQVRVTLRLSDYCPLLLGSAQPSFLRRQLYRLTQATLHRLVTVRFLTVLYRRLGGRARRIEKVKVQVVEGRDT